MRIIVDAFGGDNAPQAVIEGSVMASKDIDAEIILVGNEQTIRGILDTYDYDKNKISIRHADSVIGAGEKPVEALRAKKDSSLVVGLTMLRDGEGDGFLTAGNTGAFFAGSFRLLGRIKGVKRPALTPYLPNDRGFSLLADAGANNSCTPLNLLQFGIMGSVYMEKVFGVKNPRVGLVNNGAEETKGNDLTKAAYPLLANSNLNFIGNVEARQIPEGVADVLVCDGFVGNTILKLTEGLGMAFYGNLKSMFKKNLFTKMAAMMVKDGLFAFKKKMDYTEYGGAPLLGIDGVVVKAHGSSDAKAFCNAIKSLIRFSGSGVIEKIRDEITTYQTEVPEE